MGGIKVVSKYNGTISDKLRFEIPEAWSCEKKVELAAAPAPFAPALPGAYEMVIDWDSVAAGKTYHYTHKRSYDVAQQLYRDDQLGASGEIVTSTVYRPSDGKAYQYSAGACTTWEFKSKIDGFPPTVGFAYNQTDKVGAEYSKTAYDPTGKVALYRQDVWFSGTVPKQYRNTADEGAIVGGIKVVSKYNGTISDKLRFEIPEAWSCEKKVNIMVV